MPAMITLFLALGCGFHLASAASESGLQSAWQNYKREYGNDFPGADAVQTKSGLSFKSAAQEIKRFALFARAMKEVKEHNERFARGEVSYEQEINEYAAWTQEEQERELFGATISPDDAASFEALEEEETSSFAKRAAFRLPESFDWRKKLNMSPVRNQASMVENHWLLKQQRDEEARLLAEDQEEAMLAEKPEAENLLQRIAQQLKQAILFLSRGYYEASQVAVDLQSQLKSMLTQQKIDRQIRQIVSVIPNSGEKDEEDKQEQDDEEQQQWDPEAPYVPGPFYDATNDTISLSVQQLMDCHAPANCVGQFPVRILKDYIAKNESFVREHDYPFIKTRHACKRRLIDQAGAVRVNRVAGVKSRSEAALKRAVATLGPIGIMGQVNGTWARYKSGILNATCENQERLRYNHAFVLIGYGKDKATGATYWIIRNSWGPKWGEKGHLRVFANNNSCGYETYPWYPVLSSDAS